MPTIAPAPPPQQRVNVGVYRSFSPHPSIQRQRMSVGVPTHGRRLKIYGRARSRFVQGAECPSLSKKITMPSCFGQLSCTVGDPCGHPTLVRREIADPVAERKEQVAPEEQLDVLPSRRPPAESPSQLQLECPYLRRKVGSREFRHGGWDQGVAHLHCRAPSATAHRSYERCGEAVRSCSKLDGNSAR